MNKNNQSPFDYSNWAEVQKKYMDALTSFNSANPFTNKATVSQESFWVKAMDDWWKSVKSGTYNEKESLFEKVIDQCRNYYFMSEQFSNLIEGMSNLKSKNEDITSFINKKFQEMESFLTANQNNFHWSNLVDICEQPVELMKKAISSMPFNYGDLFADVSPEAKRIRDQYLSIPGVGYSREMQEKLQETVRLWAVYQDNYQEYQLALSKLNHEALELMRKKILRMIKKDEELNSMRQIYDLWVESNEQVYADYVLTSEYSDLNGRLVNSLMAFKKQSHEITEEMLAAMNMPTSKALNTLEHRQYELRKQVRMLETQLKSLQKEIKEKNKQVAVKTKGTRNTTKKKQIKKQAVEEKSTVVQFRPVKKKVVKFTNTVKKKTKRKTKRKTKNKSANHGMIELKF